MNTHTLSHSDVHTHAQETAHSLIHVRTHSPPGECTLTHACSHMHTHAHTDTQKSTHLHTHVRMLPNELGYSLSLWPGAGKAITPAGVLPDPDSGKLCVGKRGGGSSSWTPDLSWRSSAPASRPVHTCKRQGWPQRTVAPGLIYDGAPTHVSKASC